MTLHHRPPFELRVLVALTALTLTAATAAIMLSDRAPGVLRRLSDRLDAPGQGRLAADPRLPDGYVIVHVSLWALATLLVGWALWSWRGLIVGAAAVLTVSFVAEVAQERVTHTRTFEVGDLVANAAGVVLGSAAVAVSYLAWDAVGTHLHRRRHEP